MSKDPPDIRDILRHSVELLDLVIKDSERICAITHDSNDELTALATSIWFIQQQDQDIESLAGSAKMHIATAFYLGYLAGQKEGDLTVWEKA